MTRNEFVETYFKTAKRILMCAEKARREGLFSLEKELSSEKADERDIFEYGLRFAIDGVDPEIIGKILSNIIAQEKDEYARLLKTIQMEGVLRIQEGVNMRLLHCLLNSYTDLSLKEDAPQSSLD